jgi:uncharacterized protein
MSEGEIQRLGERLESVFATKQFAGLAYMELFITQQCNQRCDYCFVRDKTSQRMSEEVAFQAVDFLFSHAQEREGLGILFFGGEPLLEFPLIKKVVRYARKRATECDVSISFDTTTNGTLLDEEMLAFFRDEGVRYLLSIDGERADHDRHRRLVGGGSSFDAVVPKIRLFKRYQPWQGSRITVHPEAAPNMRKNVEFLFSEGINQFIIGPAHSVPWRPDDIKAFAQGLRDVCDFYVEMRKAGRPIRLTIFELGDLERERQRYKNVWGCGAGKGRVCVSVDGRLYGCSKLLSMGRDGEGILPLGDIWNGFTNYRARSLLNNMTADPRPQCQRCDVADFCTGNCPATNFEATGSIFLSGPEDCAFTRIFHETNLYLVNRLGPQEMDLLGITHPEAFTCDAVRLQPGNLPGD